MSCIEGLFDIWEGSVVNNSENVVIEHYTNANMRITGRAAVSVKVREKNCNVALRLIHNRRMRMCV